MKIPSRLVTTLVLLLAFAVASRGEEYELTSDALPQEGIPKGKVTKHIWDSSRTYPDTARDYYVEHGGAMLPETLTGGSAFDP